MIPPNCLAPGHQHDGSATISFCERCYVNAAESVRTPEEEAVIRAAVAWHRTEKFSDENLEAAVQDLLAAEPKWGG